MRRLPALAFLFLASTVLAGCFHVKKPATPSPANKKQIINALPFDQRPFVALFPHSTNKLITLYLDKPLSAKNLTVDIEYLSGNALKGGRTSVSLPTTLPYTQAFLLGSCSSGGKCSFDTDITTGSIKTKFEIGDELHLLKSNYAFVDGDSVTSDQKLRFAPTTKPKGQLIIGQSHGYISSTPSEAAAEPAVLTATSADTITGTLTISAKDATKAVYYDGATYRDLPATKEGDNLVVSLKHKPWSKTVTIIRDDLKGASEETVLYLFGPIVPLK